jgi:hypothetical protein
MTIQQAAYEILNEKQHPLSSREIAKIAVERRLVFSRAKDPVVSHAQTIEKNIRDGIYNSPQLCFLRDAKGRRVVGLPQWQEGGNSNNKEPKPRMLEIDPYSLEMIELAKEAGLGSNETKVVGRLIRTGFKTLIDEINSGLTNKLDELKKRMIVLSKVNDMNENS